ncbi:MAG: restriction endonuclease subunit S [Pseudomonadota bacterium]
MDLKEGYKQTDVGVVPEDWIQQRLGALCEISAGRDLVKEDFSPVSTGSHPNPIYSNSHSNRGLYGYSRSNQYSGNQITVTARGDVGHAEYRSLPFSAIGRLLVLTAKRPCDLRFVAEFINNIVEFALESTGVPQLTAPQIAGYSIALPPTKAEQEAIAEALGDADALIESLEELIAKKRQIKQGAMQELLTGKRRLPGFSGEWEVRTLIELAGHKRELFNDGDWVEAEHITTEGVRLVQTGNIGEGKFIDRAERKYIYEESFSSLRCKELRVGDLLICRLADPAGRACILPELGEEKIITSVDVTICRFPPDQADRTFLANLFSTQEWFKAVSDRSGGTTHKRIARGALGQIPLLLPDPAEQTAIAEILSDMDEEIVALESKLAKARKINQGMMQELLTGRIRLV